MPEIIKLPGNAMHVVVLFCHSLFAYLIRPRRGSHPPDQVVHIITSAAGALVEMHVYMAIPPLYVYMEMESCLPL